MLSHPQRQQEQLLLLLLSRERKAHAWMDSFILLSGTFRGHVYGLGFLKGPPNDLIQSTSRE